MPVNSTVAALSLEARVSAETRAVQKNNMAHLERHEAQQAFRRQVQASVDAIKAWETGGAAPKRDRVRVRS